MIALPLKRSLGYFVSALAGILIGFLVGRGVSQPPKDRPAAVALHDHVNGTSDSSRSKSPEISKTILLGNITTVPFQELYGLLAQRTPAEIETLAEQLRDLPEGRDKIERIGVFFKAWAHLDPSAALKAALDFKSVETRETAIGATIGGADATAAAALTESIDSLPADLLPAILKSALLGSAIGKWAQVDAPAAAEFLNKSTAAGMGFTLAFYDVAQNWAANDPESAMNWAIEHSTGPRGPSAVTGAITGWWQKDHAAAEAYAAAHADGPEGRQFISAIANEMARQNPRQAAAWVNNLPTPEARRDGYNMVAIQWAMNDSKAASEWAASLPNELMPAAIDSTISFWAQNDPQAAGQWVQTLGGAARDRAAAAYSNVVTQRDPAAAMTWASSINDSTVRDRAIQQVASQWKERDPAAAQAWIQNSSLDASEKARLLASPAPSP